MGEVALRASALDAVEHLLGPGEDVVSVGASDVSQVRYLAARADDLSEYGHTAHDTTVMLDVNGGGDAGNEVTEVWRSAYGFEVLGVGELAGDGDLVDGLAAFQQRYTGVVALAVALDVEVLGLEERADAGDGIAVYEYGADDGLFGVVVIRLKTVGNQALPPGWPTMFNFMLVRKPREGGAGMVSPDLVLLRIPLLLRPPLPPQYVPRSLPRTLRREPVTRQTPRGSFRLDRPVPICPLRPRDGV